MARAPRDNNPVLPNNIHAPTQRPRNRLSILYLIVIALCVISISFSYFWSNSILGIGDNRNKESGAFDPPRLYFDGSFPSASRSKSLTTDHEREAGIRDATTTTTATTTAAASADLATKSSTAMVTARAGDVFVPGSLNMTRVEAYQKCYGDKVLYKHHRGSALKFVSEKHKLVYFQIGKAGSSQIRKMLDDSFGNIVQYKTCNILQKRNATTRFNKDVYHKFTVSREPSSRFVSAFSEMMRRWVFGRSRTPPTKELKDFARVYNKTYLKEDEDGHHAVEAFETFVTNHYDGYTIPDDHLRLQIFRLLTPNDCLRLNVIHDLEDLDDVVRELLTEHGLDTAQKSETEEERARQSKLHLKISMVSVEVQQKVCQLSALDYCCLNYRLPPECEGVVRCRWREKKTSEWANNSRLTSNHSSYSANTSMSTSASTSTSINDPMLMIEAVSPYPLLPTQRQNKTKQSGHLKKDSKKRKLFTPAE